MPVALRVVEFLHSYIECFAKFGNACISATRLFTLIHVGFGVLEICIYKGRKDHAGQEGERKTWVFFVVFNFQTGRQSQVSGVDFGFVRAVIFQRLFLDTG